MKIIVFSDNYPSKTYPAVGTFVYKLVQKMSSSENKITVIAPQKFSLLPWLRNKKNYGIEKTEVKRPFFLSFSNKNIGRFNTYHIAKNTKKNAFKNSYKDSICDVVYCHFLSNALVVADVLSDSKKPIIAAVGEYKNIDVVRKFYNQQHYEKLLKRIDGYIAVSELVRLKLIDIGVDENKIIVLPNATDLDVFKPGNKLEAREKFNLPIDKKIVLFVGRFIHNKGPLVLLEALNKIQDKDVVGVFIGKGIQDKEITGEKVIMKNSLPFSEVPLMMAAADVFVLPTHHEGSSNVIVEAMASGLPIVSSDIPEIKSQCNDSFATLVDYKDAEAIKNAILKITQLEPEQYDELSSNARKHSYNYDLETRSQKVLAFCEKFINIENV